MTGDDVFAMVPGQHDAAQGYSYGAAVVTDFEAGDDVIVLDLCFSGPGPGILSIDVWDDGTGSDELPDGSVIAMVTGGQSLTVGDIVTDARILYR